MSVFPGGVDGLVLLYTASDVAQVLRDPVDARCPEAEHIGLVAALSWASGYWRRAAAAHEKRQAVTMRMGGMSTTTTGAASVDAAVKPLRSCYVSAPPYAELSVLHNVLRVRDIVPIQPANVPVGYVSLVGMLTDLIERSDFMIACLADADSSNQLFEIGYARGAGKPVLLIIAPGKGDVPQVVSGLFTVRADLVDDKALSFAIDQLLRGAPVSESQADILPIVRKPLGDQTDKYLDILRTIDVRGTKAELELRHLVIELLRAVGIQSIYENHREFGADVAVWDDNLEPMVGNPLLIEVKSTLDVAISAGTVLALTSYLQRGNARFSLLLYGYGESAVPVTRMYPGILVMSIAELIQRMREHSFADVVIELRNGSVHASQSR